MYDNGCLEKLNLMNWAVDIGFALVPAIALYLGFLLLRKKLKGSKHDLSNLSRLFKSRDGGISLFKTRLVAAICVIVAVPPVLLIFRKVKSF